MTFPESQRVVFQQNPLAEVICQLKFPTILGISAEKPAKFQNQIRDLYPFYEVSPPSLPKELAKVFETLTLPTPGGETVRFLTEDKSRCISLSPEFVAFTEKVYVEWDFFMAEVTRAKDALEETYTPAFYTRIGLRYRNVIDREALELGDTRWDQLLKPGIAGLLSEHDKIGAPIRDLQAEATIALVEVPGGLATVRHGLRRVPPDNREVYYIDTDCHISERTEGKNVGAILGTFNRLNGNLFRWAITDSLRATLGPTEIP